MSFIVLENKSELKLKTNLLYFDSSHYNLNYFEGVPEEVYYVRNGTVNEYALTFNLPLKTPVKDIYFDWISTHKLEVTILIQLYLCKIIITFIKTPSLRSHCHRVVIIISHHHILVVVIIY